MPSFTFVSTANAFVLRGASVVFVDIRRDTLNIDENLIEAAITKFTKAIVVVHYAGVACAMDEIMDVAKRHDLMVIEDSAQGVCSSYKGRPLGSFGDLATLSFHETKNIISGEGGALMVNSSELIHRAEIIREKGTNRAEFFRGEVDKYTWVDIGSSFLPSELIAAFLFAQMEEADAITEGRHHLWNTYHRELQGVGGLTLPQIPEDCQHNAHIYYVLLRGLKERDQFIASLGAEGIHAVFHYVPLHQSPMGRIKGRKSGEMTNTEAASDCLVRLPLWIGLEPKMGRIIEAVKRAMC